MTSSRPLSLRVQAVLAAGVLAVSTIAPAASVAQETDVTTEGTAAPVPPGLDDVARSPDFDPGGVSTELPFDAREPAPADAGGNPAEPLEPEPATDVDAPIADAGDDPVGAVQPQPAPGTAAPEAAPGDAPTEGVSPPAVPAPAASGQPVAAEERPGGAPAASGTTSRLRTAVLTLRVRRTQDGKTAPARPVPAAQPVASADGDVESTPTPAAPVPTAVTSGLRDAIALGDRIHAVRAGESLWSIATDRLGGQPQVTRVAREVDRLWELNRDRIGTGDPDLLIAGTRLELR